MLQRAHNLLCFGQGGLQEEVKCQRGVGKLRGGRGYTEWVTILNSKNEQGRRKGGKEGGEKESRE